MKWKNSIKIAFTMEFQKFGRTLSTIALTLVCVTLFIYGFLVSFATDYHYITSNETLSYGTENTGLLAVNTFNPWGDDEFWEKIKALDCMECVCFFNAYSGDATNIIGSYKWAESFSELGEITYIDTEIGAMDLFDLELESGDMPVDDGDENVDTIYVYLGYDFRDMSLGILSETEDDEGNVERYVLAGILQKGQKVIPYTSYLDFTYNGLNGSVSTDNAVFVCRESTSSAPKFYAFSDEYTYEEVREQCEEIAHDMDLNINISLLENEYTMAAQEKASITRAINECLIVMVLSAVCIIICIQFTEFHRTKRQYGLFYAVGMSGEDVRHIIIIRKAFETVVSALLCYGLTYIIASFSFAISGNISSVLVEILNRYCLWRLVIIELIIFAVSAGFTVRAVDKYSPVDLLEREE